jgi:hypothetical protein
VPIVPKKSPGMKKPAEMLGRIRAFRAYYYVVVEVRHDSGLTLYPSGQEEPAGPAGGAMDDRQCVCCWRIVTALASSTATKWPNIHGGPFASGEALP